MTADVPFDELLRRLRRADEEAWAEVVGRYGAEVRRVIRSRLGASLRPVVDSADVWQSVLASFFVRLNLGQFDLDTPEQLVTLLTRMARNKVVTQGRKLQAVRRDARRVEAGSAEMNELAAPGPAPSATVARRELLQKVRGQLSAEERRLADLKSEGYGWQEIATAVGGAPNALRMQLARAVDRAARQLGLDEVGDV